MLARFVASLGALAITSTLVAPAGAAAGNTRQIVAWNLSASQLKANCKREIGLARARVDRIANASEPASAANTLLPLENVYADLNDHLVAEQFLFNVSTARDVRDASQTCSDDVNALTTDLAARADMYKRLAAVEAGGTAKTTADRKLLDFYLVNAKRSGAALRTKDRATFVGLSKELGRIQNVFAANLGNDRSSITITQAQTSSLDPDFVATLKATLKKSGDGFLVPVNEATTTRFMRSETDPAARKAFYLAYNVRGGAKNVALLEQAIGIRDHLAKLLGFKTWADYQLEDKMARSPSKVLSFLDDLDARLLPGAKRDIATLASLKAKDGGAATIDPWDYTFYDNVLRKTQYNVDTNLVKQYFPVAHTIDAVLGIYSKLLGVTFAPGASDAWLPAPEVLHYSVADTATSRYIGDVYFDLYPRDGKYGHFANWPLLPNRKTAAGSRAPLAVIVGNWPQAAPGKPALLSHDDVETFFHEFGHNMAAMLSTAPYETLSGGFRHDFVEAPSQMLENWTWDPGILKTLSSNVTTGAPMPDDLIAKIIAARNVNQSYAYTRQALFAIVDMRLHTSGPKVDSTTIWRGVQAATTPMSFIDGTLPQASFGHLMGGYDAGYYGYLWSKVYAQDMFSRFAAQGLVDPTVGKAYRVDILEPAQTYEPDQEVTKFLGRPVSPDAFYKDLGLEVKR